MSIEPQEFSKEELAVPEELSEGVEVFFDDDDAVAPPEPAFESHGDGSDSSSSGIYVEIDEDDEDDDNASVATPRTLQRRKEVEEVYGITLCSPHKRAASKPNQPATSSNADPPTTTTTTTDGEAGKAKANKSNKSKGRWKRRTSPDDYFRELDVDFIGRDTLTDDVFTYEATDVLVQKSLEIPMVVSWPHARVEYEFSTTPSEVKMAVAFVPALQDGQDEHDVEVEEIVASSVIDTSDAKRASRLLRANTHAAHEVGPLDNAGTGTGSSSDSSDSSKRPTKGTFSLNKEGAVFVIFEVDDSGWLSTVLSQELRVSYRIVIYVPSFTWADYERSQVARKLLSETTLSTKTSFCHFNDCEAVVASTTLEIEDLEAHVQRAQQRLDARTKQLKHAENQELIALRTMKQGYDRMNGLCIRTLNKHLLMVTLGFLLPTSSSNSAQTRSSSSSSTEDILSSLSAVGLVNKYWNQCFITMHAFGVVSEAELRVASDAQAPDYRGDRLARGQMVRTLRAVKELQTRHPSLEGADLKSQTGQDGASESCNGSGVESGTGKDHTDNAASNTIEPSQVNMEAEPSNLEKMQNSANNNNFNNKKETTVLKRNLGLPVEKGEKGKDWTYGRGNTTAENLEIRLARQQAEKEIRRDKRIALLKSLPALAGGENKSVKEVDDADSDSFEDQPAPRRKTRTENTKSRRVKVGILQEAELQAQLDRVHNLFHEKKKIKTSIKVWIENFELESGRGPTSNEKKSLIGTYYEEYSRVGKKYKSRLYALKRTLEDIGLDSGDLKKMFGDGK